jgi:hypothetical protein
LLDRLEVGQKGVVWLHGDDLSFLRPNLLEQREQEFASLGWSGLQVPEAREVSEDRLGLLDGWFGWWPEALQFFLKRLAAHDVLCLAKITEYVQVLKALQLRKEFIAPPCWLLSVPGAVSAERF